jgi:hypothetical protein
VFLVLAVAAICTTVAFYQQAAQAKDQIRQQQSTIDASIGAAFRDNGWALDEQTPDVLGIKYKSTAYAQVADKLKQAAEYEKEVKPLLGWDTLASIQEAMRDSPAQKDAVANNQAPLSTMKELLSLYERSVAQQTRDIADLRGQVSALTKQKDDLANAMAAREKELGQQMNDLQKAHNDKVAQDKKDYDDLMASFDAQRQKTAETQASLQQEINAHKAESSKLQDEVAALSQKIHDLTVPGEGKKLTSQGSVISVDGQYDLVYIDGGKDKNYKENDTFIVYSQTPGGLDRYKATIKITQVFDTTSRASIVEEKELVLKDDDFVSTQQWDQFHPVKPAAPAAPAAAAPAAAAAAAGG